MGNEITELVAKTILSTSYSGDTRVVKREIEVALGDLLNQGKISREEFENAKNYVNDKLITALAAKNNVEFTMFSDYKELPPRMQEIMYKSCLTKTDLKELFQPYFNDYTINWVESLKTGKDSNIQTKGSITSHEFEELVVSINEKIKNNNAGETLSKGEVKDLLKEFGFAINNRNERFYGDIETSIENDGLTNPTEAKMQQLKSVEEQALANEMYSEEQIVPDETQKQETTSESAQKVEKTEVPQKAEVKAKENPYSDIFGNDTKFIEYNILKNYSKFILGLSFIVICFLLSYKGYHSYIKSLELSSYIIAFLGISSILLLVYNVDINNFNIQALKEVNINYQFISTGLFIFLGYAIINYLNNYQLNNKIYFGSIITIVILKLLTIGILGETLLNIYDYPYISILKRIQYLDFVERMEGILSLQYLFDFFFLFSLVLLTIKIILTDIFKLKKDKVLNITLSVISLMIFLISYTIL